MLATQTHIHAFNIHYEWMDQAVCIQDDTGKWVYTNQSFRNYWSALKVESLPAFATGKVRLKRQKKTQLLVDMYNGRYIGIQLHTLQMAEQEFTVCVLSEGNQKLWMESKINETLAHASAELIRPSLSLDKIASIVLQAGMELTGCQTGYVAFEDPQSDNILIHNYSIRPSVHGVNRPGHIQFVGRDHFFTRGLYGQPLNTGTYDFSNTRQFEDKEGFIESSMGFVDNYISFPTIVNDVYMGQIVLVNSGGSFNKEQIDFLHSLTHIYGLAILRKRLEWDLVHAKEKAEESNQLKSAFLANMSHEIRTPMNAIMGFSQLLMLPELRSEKMFEFNVLIQESCNDLLKLVSELIDLSRLEAEQLSLFMKPFRLRESLETLSGHFKQKHQLKLQQIQFEIQHPETEVAMIADEARVLQVIQALLDNAVKFTEQGKIILRYHALKTMVVFEVEDTGIGIPTKQQAHIFENFRQLELGAERHQGGTGLGLSLVQKLLELMKGEILLESEPGKGSLFRVGIPQYTNGKVQESKNGKTCDKAILAGKHILIVEDEPANAKLLENLLQAVGVHTHLTFNGKQALDWVKKHETDLVLMDMRMPVMDGFEATGLIREHLPNLPVVAQTAYAMKEDEEQCMWVGCNSFISKPIDKERLLQLICHELKR